jgi:hypothetical protein
MAELQAKRKDLVQCLPRSLLCPSHGGLAFNTSYLFKDSFTAGLVL